MPATDAATDASDRCRREQWKRRPAAATGRPAPIASRRWLHGRRPHPLPQSTRRAAPRTCVSARAWSMSVLASAVRPLMAQPMCSSISATFWMLLGSCGRGGGAGARAARQRCASVGSGGACGRRFPRLGAGRWQGAGVHPGLLHPCRRACPGMPPKTRSAAWGVTRRTRTGAHQERRGDALLHRQHHALTGRDADRR